MSVSRLNPPFQAGDCRPEPAHGFEPVFLRGFRPASFYHFPRRFLFLRCIFVFAKPVSAFLSCLFSYESVFEEG